MNIDQKFTFSSKPFPHVIIDNTYSRDEYPRIWKELKFHGDNALEPINYAAAKVNGKYLSTAKGLILNELYSRDYRELSFILTTNDGMFFRDSMYDEFLKHDPYWITFKKGTNDITKIRKYAVGDSYAPHCDHWVQVLISTTLCPAEDKGGNFIFPDHDYEIETKDNRTVIIPGWIKHGITEIQENDRYAITTFAFIKPPD